MPTRVGLTLVGASCFLAIVLSYFYRVTKTPVDSHRVIHRTRTLRQMKGPNHTMTSIEFNYNTGTASRIVTEEGSGKILSEERLPGRPQSSREEFKEAVEIIGRDRKPAAFIKDGAVAEGGFIVDGPSDHPSQDRYIQIRLLTPDRGSLLRVVLVDLTKGVVASERTNFE
jgi:hypothetical protein